ncbi:Retinoblastoma-binding protein 5 [Nymphon striatum]|nr:Retinoblastoma-binding protein 5 [Nymphon striatum]
MKHPAVMIKESGEHALVPVDEESDVNVVASFDRRGHYLYTGNSKGKIQVLTCPNMKLIASFKVTTGTSNATTIKSIEFARRGECFLVNTADRIIRVYEGKEVIACGKNGEPEPVQKLQDLVNKTMWKKCCFSGDGEFICAGSARQHALYIWEKHTGTLVKILHGTKGELLLDVVWHPVRPIIASISSGVVSVWAQNQVENWSAFAPDFKELDENVEYEERESEFDIEDEDKSVELNAEQQEEDEDVDVVTCDPIAAFCSSDEEREDENVLLYLPISPDVEDLDESWAAQPEQVLAEIDEDVDQANSQLIKTMKDAAIKANPTCCQLLTESTISEGKGYKNAKKSLAVGNRQVSPEEPGQKRSNGGENVKRKKSKNQDENECIDTAGAKPNDKNQKKIFSDSSNKSKLKLNLTSSEKSPAKS